MIALGRGRHGLVFAGDNTNRFRSEAAFAKTCSAADNAHASGLPALVDSVVWCGRGGYVP
jgi:hypothetical protein